MSAVSIIGAYNSKFGSFVTRDHETGVFTDLKSIYELIIESGKGALADAGIALKANVAALDKLKSVLTAEQTAKAKELLKAKKAKV